MIVRNRTFILVFITIYFTCSVSNGIMSKIYFHPLHLKSHYQELLGLSKGDLPKTEELADVILTLPMYPHMTKEELGYITKTISDFENSKS